MHSRAQHVPATVAGTTKNKQSGQNDSQDWLNVLLKPWPVISGEEVHNKKTGFFQVQ
jgi:hypothetical protein